MSQKQKLLARLRGEPTDFAYDEMLTPLRQSGFSVSNAGRTSGSRVKFTCGDITFRMHKPHPGNTLPMYSVRDLIKRLEGEK